MTAFRWLVAIALAGLAGCSMPTPEAIAPSSLPSPVALPFDTANLAALEARVFRKVNQYRRSRGLTPLNLDRSVSQQARLHSQRMANGISPVGHGDFDRRVRAIAVKVPYRSAGENVAVHPGYDDPVAIALKGWIESPSHRQNLEGNFDTTGIGIAADSGGKLYFTQIFLEKSPAIAPNSTDVLAAGSSLIPMEQATNDGVNRYRASRGLRPLTLDPRVSYEARLFSQKMAAKKAPFSHDGFEERMRAVQRLIPLRSMGENLAWMKGYKDPVDQAVQGWIKSPGHEKNMVGDFDTTGIGIARNSEGAYYFTQLFVKKR
jgi:uncharacterized protein YkwD